ncbi:MAG: cation diffusion facilitator family transporter [Oscillospiraceae bacterium]|jgi:cation diffusion facilitator family transporter|nr:cation diffusion facilitator family transporter [Oscillospiraceae bacterium]
MTNFLIKLFIKDSNNTHNAQVRENYGKLAGAVGIASNLLLFAFKLLAGLLSGSISIMADAVNNLSDSASSIITLAGFKLSGMPADEKHPYGYARFEYISGLVVSCIILVIGFQFLISSFQKILAPTAVIFSYVTVVVLALSMLVKLWQGRFNRAIGKRIKSAALIATAADSRNDVLTTGVVLASALISHFSGLNIDGYMGVLVALFILYSGVGLIRETLGPLLGAAPERELVDAVQKKILAYDTVIGLHDLMVHNYGPERCFASVHVEFPASQDIMISHDIIDNIERDFASDLGIALVVHLDPVITDDPRLDHLKEQVLAAIQDIDPVLDLHDFRMVEGVSHTNLIFDIVVPPRYKTSDKALRARISERIKAISPVYFCVITVDRSYITSVQK